MEVRSNEQAADVCHIRQTKIFNHVCIKIPVVVCQILVVMLSLSCGISKSQNSNQMGLSDSGSSNAKLSEQKNAELSRATSGIRQIDFGNFTYAWYPSFLKPALGRRELTLVNKSFEVDLDNQQGIAPVKVELAHVLYADLTEDGQEEAVVYLAGSVPTNSFLGNLLVYKLLRGQPKLLWQHETGDRGNGGLRGFKVEGGRLIVEEYDPKVNAEESLCCPKKFRRSFFRWKNGRFARDKSEVVLNEYPNAYFVGYPADQP